jgi:anti-sigma factor RsiW
MSTCRQVASLLEPYTDGELLPERVVEVEQHVENCPRCSARVKLDRSIRLSVRKAVYEAAPPSTAFLARLGAALEAERKREAEAAAEREAQTTRGRALTWRSIAPLAAAAAVVTVWAASTRQEAARAAAPSAVPQVTAGVAEPVNLDQVLDDLVDYHLNPAKPVVTEPAQLEQLDPEVGVPVRLPRLAEYGARWEGASVIPISVTRPALQPGPIGSPSTVESQGVVPVRGRRVALLRYHLSGHRMTLYVYDAAKMPLERRLQARVVRNEPVYVGYKRGFSIAATERRGVGYAVATDLDDHESAEIVASLHH